MRIFSCKPESNLVNQGNKMKALIFLAALSFTSYSFAQTTSQINLNQNTLRRVQENIGMNYFSFWEGPSLEDGQTGKNEINRPLDSGLSLFNLVSFTYRLNEKYNFDLQNRLEWIHTQQAQWRFQGLRVGISGKLLEGKNWKLNGAFNTDVPEVNGRDARARTVLFNPGLFAGLTWNFAPKWSMYTILSPRIFFYRDDQAVEKEWLLSGRDPGEKPRAIFQASPTLNYAVTDKFGIRSGLDLQFRQFVESEPGYFKRWPSSWSVGPTYSFAKSLNVYTFVQTWPFDGEKMTMKTASVGMWLSGVLF
jgi:hypothetical protein